MTVQLMADEITLERFRELYPEFNDPVSTDTEVVYALELAQEIHRCSANAIYALAAHFLALANIQGTGGTEPSSTTVQQVQKSKVGRITTEYVKMASSGNSQDSYYETTPYGRTYLALRNAALNKMTTRVY